MTTRDDCVCVQRGVESNFKVSWLKKKNRRRKSDSDWTIPVSSDRVLPAGENMARTSPGTDEPLIAASPSRASRGTPLLSWTGSPRARPTSARPPSLGLYHLPSPLSVTAVRLTGRTGQSRPSRSCASATSATVPSPRPTCPGSRRCRCARGGSAAGPS